MFSYMSYYIFFYVSLNSFHDKMPQPRKFFLLLGKIFAPKPHLFMYCLSFVHRNRLT